MHQTAAAPAEGPRHAVGNGADRDARAGRLGVHSAVAPSVLVVTAVLQIVALLSRCEAWHLTIQAAGGTVDRRVLYRASSFRSSRSRSSLLLNAVGVDASVFDAVAVLIAVVLLGQLPVGPSVGAAAAVLILGSDGVAAAAAAGVLMTVTGTIGGLAFAAWAVLDGLWSRPRRGRRERVQA